MDPYSFYLLDTDPDQQKMNADPQPWLGDTKFYPDSQKIYIEANTQVARCSQPNAVMYDHRDAVCGSTETVSCLYTTGHFP